MKYDSLRKHPLIAGTMLLTLAGILSRVIGFFYRIFLSQKIGAEGMGIYQLTVPIYVLTISLTSSAIQTAISRFVAQAAVAGVPGSRRSSGENKRAPLGGCSRKNNCQTPFGRGRLGLRGFTSNDYCNESCYLGAGLILSLSLSFLCTYFLYQFAEPIAVHFLEEPRCTSLLQIIALSIPFGAVHSCINGYFYGLKKTFVPATSQLLEQIVRVAGVWLFFEISMEKYQAISLNLVVWGLVAGEAAAMLFSMSFVHGTDFFPLPAFDGKSGDGESFTKPGSRNAPGAAKVVRLFILRSVKRIRHPYRNGAAHGSVPIRADQLRFRHAAAADCRSTGKTGKALHHQCCQENLFLQPPFGISLYGILPDYREMDRLDTFFQ